MAAFVTGHATHPDWRMALALASAQIDAQLARQHATEAGPPTLGFVYFTDAYAGHAEALLEALRTRWPRLAWVGCVGIGVAASGVEYFDEPALVLMLAPLAPGRFEVFSGARPLSRIEPYTEPWKLLVPDLVMALTPPPVNPPCLMSYGETTTCSSCTESREIGCASVVPPGVPVLPRPNRSLLTAPSIWIEL
jgi:hypothetical protein